ncbi:hypothetical protein C8R44DRAFT_687519 [Mycena epipterygia]|nr:hypothetical protein C8R44DRAFT_687519 [Mycena epipterygia]
MSIARHTVISQARAFASAANVVRTPTPAHTLSPDKMRALVAMYHQTETFVTKENLDAKIDEAFTGKLNNTSDAASLTLRDFETLLRKREELPTVTEWNAQPEINFRPSTRSSGQDMNLWSAEKKPAREFRVIEALYGMEWLGGGKMLPGFDAVNADAELFESSAKEDQEMYEDSDY